MPDISAVYTLTTPAGAIVFNDGGLDQFYISEIPSGLAGAPLRTPIDPVPYGDGSRSYNFWKEGRHILIEGLFLITSTLNYNAILTIRNEMEEELRAALDSIGALDIDTATLDWTPLGQPSRSLIVRNDVPLECVHDQNYLVRNFTFGLFADDPLWTESS